MIRRAAHNTVFANLLAAAIIGLGLYYFARTNRETFPIFALDRVQVMVVHKGASPEDIEDGICVKVEEAIEGIEGITKIESTAQEGVGIVVAKIDPEIRTIQDAIDEIKTEIDRVEFPEDAEKPTVTQIKTLTPVLQIAIYGEADERELKILAEEVRKEVLALPEVTQAEVEGVREYEVRVEVSQQELERLGLRLDQVVSRIQAESLNLSAGSIRSEGGEVTIRTVGKRRAAREFEEIPIIARPDGSQVRLRDVARVLDDFDEDEIRGRFSDVRETVDGKPHARVYGARAVQVNVNKTSEEDLITIAEEVREYVDRKKKSLPPGVQLEIWLDYSPLLKDRLKLLYVNMLQGLFWVFVILLVFLGFRLAFWVTWGVPVAFLGTFVILHVYGGTLDMSSTFAAILVLGMLVDDGIVIAENVYSHYQRGKPAVESAIDGTNEVLIGVIASSATTIAAFLPVFFVAGEMGKIMRVMPLIVGGALTVSLIESMFSLPNHLAHSLPKDRKKAEQGWWPAFRRAVDRGMTWFLERLFQPVLDLALKYKGATIGICLGALAVTFALVTGGHVAFVIMPEIDSDFIRCRVELPPGTSVERTDVVVHRLEEAIQEVNAEVRAEHGDDIIWHVFSTSGARTGFGGATGSHLGEVMVMVRPSELGRPLVASKIIARWREKVGDVPDVERFNYGIIDVMPTEAPIGIRLVGQDTEELRRASADLRAKLATYPGVVDIVDDDRKGKIEYQYTLKVQAASYGITVQDFAFQLRQAFFGAKSVSVQRGREDVDVLVLLPESSRKHAGDIDDLEIRSPTGAPVPIQTIADRKLVRSLVSIQRVDRNRAISVTTGLDETKTNAEKIAKDLEETYVEEFLAGHPGVRWEFAGQRGQMEDSLSSLITGSYIGLALIYIVIALIFRSFIQPLVIMSIIPVSMFGGILFHWLLGHDLSLMSIAGLVGLAGIVVNDSIVLIEYINDCLARGETLDSALRTSGRQRFRAIFLTSSTTFAGLAPMIMETSGQAKFLIPMAISIAFGVLFETVFVLFLIPALLSVTNTCRRFMRWVFTGVWPTPEQVEPATQRVHKIEEDEHRRDEPVALPEEIAAVAASPAIPRDLARRETLARLAPRGTRLVERPGAPGVPPAGLVTRTYKRFGTVDELLAEASAKTEAEDMEGAAVAHLAALRREPERADLHFALGMLRGKMGDWTAAYASIDRAVEIEPENLDYREYRGWAALQAGNFEAAASDFSARIEAEPDHLLALKGRATARLALDDAAGAIEDLSAALVAAPKNADLLFLRGNAYRRKKKHKLAVADYDAALERRPNHARALLYRGLSLESLGDLQRALRSLEDACAADPELHEAILHRGRVRLALRDHAGAILDFSAYLTLAPEDSRAYLHRGKARAAAGDAALAVRDFEIYLEADPKSKEGPILRRYIAQQAKLLAK
ncbi:MAG: efflux RND transporter permease subunit [Planctomycetes bacterium]|nr:efflux RND transporter permease subunit [Planctomycetota bacterium]